MGALLDPEGPLLTAFLPDRGRLGKSRRPEPHFRIAEMDPREPEHFPGTQAIPGTGDCAFPGRSRRSSERIRRPIADPTGRRSRTFRPSCNAGPFIGG
jgi:hypothetical protein